jgi:pimeloyl-ACP methyl ester carboxylesterase
VNKTLADASYDTVTIDGLPVHFVDYGGRVLGPTFVLVHGLGGSHLNWDLLAPLLVQEGYVYSLDLPGFGKSEPLGRDCSVEANVRVLEKFVEGVGGTVHLVGNSMGAMVSVLLAASRPDLVDGLVLLDPAAAPPGPGLGPIGALYTGATFWLLEAIQGRTGLMTAERKAKLTMKACGVDPTGIPQYVTDRTVALMEERTDAEAMDKAFFQAARSCTSMMIHPGRYRRAMDALECPVLLIHGDRDRLVPVQSARDVAKRNPDWTYVELPGIGHVPQLEIPHRTFDEICNWLAAI